MSKEIPREGEIFTLTLAAPMRPLDMVQRDGWDPEGWQHNGQPEKTRTGRFKLVRPGYCLNLNEVRTKVTAPGQKPAAGQWREAFKIRYPTPDGRGPIGVPDPSWVHPCGRAKFPMLHDLGESWGSDFDWADVAPVGHFSWLVEVV